MEFTPGTRVRFLDDVGEATVVKIIDEDTVLIEDESGFEYEYATRQLLQIENRAKERDAYDGVEPSLREIIDRNIDPAEVKRATDDFDIKYKNHKATNQKRRGEHMEVDLHMSELVDNELGLDHGEKLDIQLRHFEKMLKMAERQRVPRVIFIHGIGQGVLRAEIRKMLDQFYPHCSFHDAPYHEYGHGATEVRINFGR